MSSVNFQDVIVPEKYGKLQRVEKAGLPIPRSLLITSHTGDDIIHRFICQFSRHTRFIVRSAYSEEDGGGRSYAGHFHSSTAVDTEQLFTVIEQCREQNRTVLEQLALTGQLNLILQEYIEHDFGGVLFTPWSFFPDYACIAYSKHGAQAAVTGHADTAVIALDSAIASPLPLQQDADFLRVQLQSACRGLRAAFEFAVDCEWAWSSEKQQLVILQVRPQTHAVGPVLALPDNHKKLLPEGDWQYTAISESLGRLSPLSFSLFQQLYMDLCPSFKRLGCKAEHVDFLLRVPDGTVLVDTEREALFYASTRFGGFWRGFRTEQFRQQALTAFAKSDAEKPFNYACLSEVFAAWMICNFLSRGAGRSEQLAAHTYELSWHQFVDLAVHTKDIHDSSWEELNRRGRDMFILELNKLKRELAPYPQRVFCDFQAYQAGNFSQAESAQHAEVCRALYDYASVVSVGENGAGTLSLASNQEATGTAYIIQQPGRQHTQIPADCILIAPYFDNAWVGAIYNLRGIVVQRGNPLSHSVIVAREAGVPYCVMPDLDIAAFVHGAEYTLNPRQKTLL
ncbi:MAG: PEP-utilizing enzyme [Thiolinea sp.]